MAGSRNFSRQTQLYLDPYILVTLRQLCLSGKLMQLMKLGFVIVDDLKKAQNRGGNEAAILVITHCIWESS